MNRHGFVLAELLVSLAVLGIVLAGVFALQQQGQSAYLFGAARVEAQQSARATLDLFTHEARLARGVTAVGAGCNNAATGASDITFEVQDPVTGNWVPVRYQRTGANLQRTYNNGVATVVVGGLQALKIVCYSAADAPTAVPGDVRRLTISFTLLPEEYPTISHSPASQQIAEESTVTLRNI